MSLDVQKLVEPISESAPCGEDLSYDPLFLALEQESAGKPERQMGDSVLPAEEPDWKSMRKMALECFERTRDLRVVMLLILANLKLEGIPGLRDGLAVLRGMLEKYWEQVWPQLDPDDGFDPELRINILSALARPRGSQQEWVLERRLREAPLAVSRQLGTYGLREVMQASGELPPPADGEAPKEAVIQEALAQTPPETLAAVATAARESADHLRAIDQILTERVGSGKALDLRELTKVLERIATLVGAHQSGGAAAGGRSAADAEAGYAAAPAASGGGAGGQVTPVRVGTGQISSRHDVVELLDTICDYYTRNEPSSPVPLLLRRAQRLVPKSFLEIIRDMSPDAISSIEQISGPQDQE